MVAQPPAQEKDLRVKAPVAHVGVEIGQVWVVVYGLGEGHPAQLFAQQRSQSGFADAHVSGNGDEAFCHGIRPQSVPIVSM